MATILIVEDSDDTRQMMVDMLESLGHSTLEAADGLEAVKVALTTRPDLILMDLMMPKAAGDSSTRFIRGTPELQGIPLLVVSAHPEVAQIAADIGADSWVAKPLSLDELRRRVNGMLGA
jgi:CheY-like chemotaxis protein